MSAAESRRIPDADRQKRPIDLGSWVNGVISYSVSQRTREIGFRIALGAQNAEVTRMFVRHGLTLAAIGIACGLAAAFALMRLMSSLLFDVSPIDPLTYGAVALSLVAAAVVASWNGSFGLKTMAC